MTMEEKEWLECNPVYVIKNDKLYYKRDILELPRNCKCKLTVECVHSESAYPTVPTLSIPNGYNGYITVNAEKYPQIPNLSTKKSSKLSIRIAENIRDTCFVNRIPACWLFRFKAGFQQN